MADAVFLLAVFYGLVLGARRGLYKEVVNVLALLVAISVARMSRVPAGVLVAQKTGAPPLLAEVMAVVAVWVVVFFAAALVGRLILKKIRGKGVDDRIEDGAELVADAIGGDTTKGPITLLTDPIASKNGFFYWSDKILGSLLGLVKGILTGYVIFGIALYADRIGYPSAFARSVEGSYAGALFKSQLDPLLRQFAEYQIAVQVADMREIARLVHEDPKRFEVFVNHPELTTLARDPAVQALLQDPKVRAAWDARDLKALLVEPRVHALIGEERVRQHVGAVRWAAVREAVASGKLLEQPPR
jgi:uncharacterized membrane protein required for colicin V production